MNDTSIKMPLLLKAFLFCYMGSYGWTRLGKGLNHDNLFIDVITICLYAIFASFTVYGIICFLKDVKEGGIAKVLKKLNEFLNHK